MHSENYNYLNPTQLLDLCCSVVQFVTLDCRSIVVVKTTLQIGSLVFYVLQQRGNTEAYLESSRTSTMERILAINYFCKRAIFAIFAQALNTRLSQVETYYLSDYTYHQIKSPQDVAVLVYFNVLHLLMERSRQSAKRNVFKKFANNHRKAPVLESLYFNKVARGS